MMQQLEITTRCNFDCFYCAGREMRQGDMPYDMFTALVERHIASYGVPKVVSLQGEGEPTLHRDFLRLAEFVRERGATPYTITNGTYKHPERLVGLFPEIGVSIDTLDEAAAHQIGRYNLPRVLAFVEALAPHATIVVHTVAHKEHTPPIVEWCRRHGYRHRVQPLQTKPDYSRRYGPGAVPRALQGRFSCGYLAQPRMRYYTLDGLELPCCYIKDTSAYEGMAAMLRHQQAGTWSKCCEGCRFGQTTRPVPVGRTRLNGERVSRSVPQPPPFRG
jgi:pyruvate-formate lyase-activating enzyme